MATEIPLRPEAVCAITVTFADRFALLNRNISALLEQGVGRILVVNNASHSDSRNRLGHLASQQGRRITIIDFERNYGPGRAFSRAMAYACDHMAECPYFLLLDDDLLPEPGALRSLIEYWQASPLMEKQSRLCLAANRDSGKIYRDAVSRRSPRLVLGPVNSFWGFHIRNLLRRKANKLRRREADREENSLAEGELEVAPYGGLFFHKDLLKKAGFPREDYFLYVDDYEFTFRITQAKGSIHLVLASRLADQEPTWETNGKGPHVWIVAGSREFKRLYYTARNFSHFLGQQRTTSTGCYHFNITVFLVLFSACALLRGNPQAIPVMLAALRDGQRGRLGESMRFR